MSNSEPIKTLNVYKSKKCTPNDLDTNHENFTFVVLLQETMVPIGILILGILVILYGIHLMNAISNTVSMSDVIPMKYAAVTIAGGALVVLAGWLARKDVAGFVTSDIIERCK